MSRKSVIHATLKGLNKAHRTYFDWSGGFYLHGVEYIATFCIAREISALESVSFVTCESNVRKAIEFAGRDLRGYPKSFVAQGSRFDITVWNKVREPIVVGLIEVKTTVLGFSNLKKDIEKICKAVKKPGNECFGLVAYFASIRKGKRKRICAAERLSKRTTNISDRAAEYCHENYRLKTRRHPANPVPQVEQCTDGDGSVFDVAWSIEVLEICKKK